MEKSFFKIWIESGIREDDSPKKKRAIILSNSIALILSSVNILLFALVQQNHNVSGFVEAIAGTLIFSIPILLNRLGLTNVSRLYLCWFSPILILSYMIGSMREADSVPVSSYDGLRFYLLATSSIPYLLLEKKNLVLFLAGVFPSLFGLLFCDVILDFAGVGYLEKGISMEGYSFTPIRAIISYLIINGSCFSLQLLIERGDALNRKLLAELSEKNQLIRQQAKDELFELNRQLHHNLKQLTEREFILNQSQQIAKMGSWEYRIKDSFIFWSEEMYTIFGLDPNFDLKEKGLSQLMWEEHGEVLTSATITLLRTGKSFDITLRAKNPFGYKKWVRVCAFPILDDDITIGARGICHDVTLYKEAEELLRTSEYRYRSLFEQASDFIMILDFKGRFVDVNESLCTAFGYSKEELAGLTIEALIDPHQLKGEPIRYEQLNRGEHVFSHRRMMHKDGTIIDVEANVKKIQGDKMLVIARDVTKLRETQHQIQLSEAKFRGAFEYSATGMALVSLEGKWLKVNKELCHIIGYSEEELLSLTFQDITHPDDLDKDLAFLNQTLRGEAETYQIEKRYVHKNKSIVWINLNVSLIRDNDGKPQYFISQIEDITIEKIAKEKLLLSEANLRATINNTQIMIWSVDRNFRLLMCNMPFFNYIKTHYGIEIKVGSRILETTTEETVSIRDTWQQNYMRSLSGETINLDESRFGIDLHYSLSPIIESDQIIGVSVFGENVTERNLRDRELAEANKKVGELKLMALRSVMSPHFIFNVLNSIQYFIAKNDRLNAINYLSTFSKLIRSILTHSVNNKIKLNEEIEMLKNYVQLELTRFENKFEFFLTIDSEVDADGIEIPSLLIQPYVENAILHGLYNKKDKGSLSIRVHEKDDVVVFEIEDDGVGREAALKLRQQNFPAHTSMGIKLTEERLKLISQHHAAAFEIEDLMKEGQPCGTKVTIRIAI